MDPEAPDAKHDRDSASSKEVADATRGKGGASNPYSAPGVAQSKPAGKRSYAGIFLAISVFAVGAVALAAWSALCPKPALKPDLDYLSDDAVIVLRENLSALRTSSAGQRVMKNRGEFFAAINLAIQGNSRGRIALADIDRLTGAVGPRKGAITAVAHFHRAINKDDLPVLDKGRKELVGRYHVCVDERGNAACQINDQTVVAGDYESLKKVLERDGPATFSDELAGAIKDVDFSKPIVAAVATKSLVALIENFGAEPSDAAQLPKWLDVIESCGAQLELTDVTRLRLAVTCVSRDGAERIGQMIKELPEAVKARSRPLPSSEAKFLDSIQCKVEGQTVRITASGDFEALLSLVSHSQ